MSAFWQLKRHDFVMGNGYFMLWMNIYATIVDSNLAKHIYIMHESCALLAIQILKREILHKSFKLDVFFIDHFSNKMKIHKTLQLDN